MLFLLNDRILDVGDAVERLTEALDSEGQRASLYRAVTLGQEALFAAGSFKAVHPMVELSIAAMIAMTSEANAALFVAPTAAGAPKDIAVRLASAPLTTLSRLAEYQREGRLSASVINAHVWSLAGGASAA